MIFLDENIPTDYRFIVDLSDNYVILYNHSTINNLSSSISVYIQFFTPSQCLYIPNYYLSNSSLILTDLDTIYSLDNNSLLSSSSTYLNYTVNLSQLDDDYISSSVFDRADFPQIFICSLFIMFIFAFIFNQLTKLVKKGGIFGSN